MDDLITRKVLESVDALTCHLQGNKHLEALKNPSLLDSEGYQLINGKWKQKFPAKNGGLKRKFEENGGDEHSKNGAKLSKRERTKKNKSERNIEILPQHTEVRMGRGGGEILI